MDTPAIIINANKMDENIRKAAEIAKRYGVNLRPHTKTHKIPDIAKKQLEAGACGITVAKVSEAEVMAGHGIDDIFVAYPVVTEAKLERAAELNRSVHLTVGVDSIEGAVKMSEVARRHNRPIRVRMEVDTGFKRTGVRYEHAMKLAYQLQSLEFLIFKGIYTFRGSFMDGNPTLDFEKAGLEEGRLMVDLAERMRNAGIEVSEISVGSTPTAPFAAQVRGVTEVRPGTYVFFDRWQAALGCCSLEECAAAVRVTVVSRPDDDFVVIDGGSKTFATDIAPDTKPLFLKGYGHIVEAPHAILERLSEEHGMVRIRKEDPFQVGDVLHVIPNHICSTLNLHNKVYIEDDSGIHEKTVFARGMLS
ncbi:alanine racemase [Paenibacillus thermotolerans]|uniref:alanine racemase n=1 Tax=Paenibacillus thermotolerans TaxID=3027807 RepID=UPI002367AB1B|nr:MULTISPECIES: alanine racemase [unclassified Paenibacillus]